MELKIHHTTIESSLGNCLICGSPIINFWKDKDEKNGFSEQYIEKKYGVVHHKCSGGKTLHQLNEERKLIK